MKTIISISLFLLLLVPCFGADKAIHQLTTGSPAVGTDYVPIDRQSGPNWNNFKLTVYDIQAANSNYIYAVSNYFSTVVVSNSSGVVSYNGRTGIVTMVSQDVFDANGLTNNQSQDVALFGNLSTFSGWNSNSLLPGHITISRSAGPALVLRQSGQVLGSIPAATNTLELSSAGVFFDAGTFLGSSLKAGTVVASAINPSDWLLATQQYSGWTNSSGYIWPEGQPMPTTNAPGPAMFFTRNGSLFFGTNAWQDSTINDTSKWQMVAMSMTDSNESPEVNFIFTATDNENYNHYSQFRARMVDNKDAANAVLSMEAFSTNGAGGDLKFTISNTGLKLAMKSTNTTTFAVNEDGNIRTLRGMNYYWPLAHGTGALTNDGSGNLGWSPLSSQVWTNDGNYTWLTGQPRPDTNGVLTGPAFSFFKNGSLLIGSNVLQDFGGFATNFVQIGMISMTDSNECPNYRLEMGATDSENYGNYSQFQMTGYSRPAFGLPTWQLFAETKSTNYDSIFQVDIGGTGTNDTQIMLKQDGDIKFLANKDTMLAHSVTIVGTSNQSMVIQYTNGTGVDYVLKDEAGNGIFTPSAPVIGYQTNAWSGPTNDVNIGGLYDLNYAATTSIAITGFTNKPSARTAEVMLSIYNNSATNITMTLPAGVADGDYTISHTITNGTVGYFWLRYTPQGPRTNCVFRQM